MKSHQQGAANVALNECSESGLNPLERALVLEELDSVSGGGSKPGVGSGANRQDSLTRN
jgi:hypothetical protein